jgi:putative ABC transport system permease protein
MPLALRLAVRNLYHDRLRFVATVIGIVFSVVLVMVQMGLYTGFARMVTTMIDHANADLWVVPHRTKSFEDMSLLDMDAGAKLMAIKGVAKAIPVVIGFSGWRMPGGEVTPVFVVGAGQGSGGLKPWSVVEGTLQALAEPGAVAADRSYFERLGVSGIGAAAEIRGHKVRIAAVTDGIRSFTTTPYIFAELGPAQSYIGLPPGKASDLLVQLEPGSDASLIRREIESSIPGVDVLTPEEFRSRSRSFWLFGTGAGAALFAGALLGVIVGTVIVAQTLYSSTKDHLTEFATLRAIGCSNRYIYKVIRYQALINAVIGFCAACLIGAAVVHMTAESALPIVITPALVLGLFILTILMCTASALLAIVRVTRTDPVLVLMR